MFEKPKYKKPNKDLNRQKRAMKSGRGLGEKEDYKPFIQVTRGDFALHGRSEIVKDPVSGRQHHLLSFLEYFIFLMLLHLGATEVREQFPLGLEDDDTDFMGRNWVGMGTLSAAEALAMRHPQITGEDPRVQTTDMLAFSGAINAAIFVRYASDIPRSGRQLELLKLHTLYWQERGIPLYVLSEKDLNLPLVDLLLWAFPSRRTHPHGASKEFLGFLEQCAPLGSLLEELDKWRGGGGRHEAVNQFKAGVFMGQIHVTAATSRLRPLNRPWQYKVVHDLNPETRLACFLNGKVAQHV